MAEQDDTIRDLAAIVWAVAYRDRSATRRVEALLPRLGIGANDSMGMAVIEAGLRKSLPTLPADADGADAELDEILSLAYACTRVWEAWQYGTMSEDDFTPAAETEIRADLLAWRDAAVAKALGVPAGAVASLDREQLGTALSALEDAADYRREYQDGDCADCDALPEGGRCGDHDCDEAVAGMYDLLHEELQEHQGRRSTPGLAEARGETGECKRIGGCLAEIGARTKPNSDPGLWKCGSCGRGPWDIPADVAAIPWGGSR